MEDNRPVKTFRVWHGDGSAFLVNARDVMEAKFEARKLAKAQGIDEPWVKVEELKTK